ncbi:thioredoxin family protein [Halorientalis sp. IM1011]|uniref:thioredoxin family protein n=1 Tax=Halorientalis sp. IM1011 TaxID=1932360 RepID=UPI00097CC99A|nr:thioredoxin family protein [Halorientalis sp. IM1011]AQL42564.1 thioredoxin family protein [Halorientalis sp. IM1011]
MNARKSLTAVVLVVALGVGYTSMSTAPVLRDDAYSYHGDTKWHTDYERAATIADEQNRPMLVYFWTTWCTYCEDYDENVYSDPTVRDRLDEFVLVAVNLDNDGSRTSELVNRYDANYPPQLVATHPNGTRLVKINGYVERDRFLSHLDRAERRMDR